jgi:hypothetical protein
VTAVALQLRFEEAARFVAGGCEDRCRAPQTLWRYGRTRWSLQRRDWPLARR